MDKSPISAPTLVQNLNISKKAELHRGPSSIFFCAFRKWLGCNWSRWCCRQIEDSFYWKTTTTTTCAADNWEKGLNGKKYYTEHMWSNFLNGMIANKLGCFLGAAFLQVSGPSKILQQFLIIISVEQPQSRHFQFAKVLVDFREFPKRRATLIENVSPCESLSFTTLIHI